MEKMIIINVEIPKELRIAIKVLAAETGRTFKSIVIESLYEKLLKQESVEN